MNLIVILIVDLQVDSGYNTTSVGTASLIDGLSSMSNGKESFSSNLPDEAFPFPRQSKSKVDASASQLKNVAELRFEKTKCITCFCWSCWFCY